MSYETNVRMSYDGSLIKLHLSPELYRVVGEDRIDIFYEEGGWYVIKEFSEGIRGSKNAMSLNFYFPFKVVLKDVAPFDYSDITVLANEDNGQISFKMDDQTLKPPKKTEILTLKKALDNLNELINDETMELSIEGNRVRIDMRITL
jgi:hypothetical protein